MEQNQMEMRIVDELNGLKSKIHENVAVDDSVVCQLCDELIHRAKQAGDWQSVAFGHVWRADHFFYVTSDQIAFSRALDLAQLYVDEKKPSELLEKFYTLKHVLLENTFDIHAAFQYCLKALAVAEKLGLQHRIGANFGNLGTYFLDYGCYEEALDYTQRAVHVLRTAPEAKPRLLRLLLSNLVQIHLKLDRVEPVAPLLEELRGLPVAERDLKIYVDHGYLLYHAKRGDTAKCLHFLQALLEGELLHLHNRAFIVELLTSALEAILQMGLRERAASLLETLESVIHPDEPEPRLTLLRLRMDYARRFEPPQAMQPLYRAYADQYFAVQDRLNQLKTDGMRAKLELELRYTQHAASHQEIQRLHQVVNFDELTQVYNRRYFNIRQAELTNRAGGGLAGFVLVDIDYFKEFNDHFGHAEGDRLLAQVASLLRQFAGDDLQVFRFGGDEFVCLSWGLRQAALADFAGRVARQLQTEPWPHPNSRCADHVTLSVGYGCRQVLTGMDMMTLFDQVDQALYAAKAAGRNAVRAMPGHQKALEGGASHG